MAEPSLSAQLHALLRENPDGVPDMMLREHFGTRYEQLPEMLNPLLQTRRLQLLTDHAGKLFYKVVSEEKATKLQGLTREQELVYQEIKRSGNKGIWTKKIKQETNVQQTTLTKTLKLLEQRQLIKSVKSVTSRSRKLYMLYEVVPAPEITGGAWYTDGEFDHNFVESLSQFVLTFVHKSEEREGRPVSLTQIEQGLLTGGIYKVELSRRELVQIINTLVYDGNIIQVDGGDPMSVNAVGDGPVYKFANKVKTPSFLSDTPCGVCRIRDQCYEGGAVSPTTCDYMTGWLNLNELSF